MRGMPGAVSGLRPRSPEPAPPAEIAARLAELSPAAAALLRHVDAHGGEGTTGAARRTVSPAEAASPAEELLSRRLLVPRDGDTVVLPGRGRPGPARRPHDHRAGRRRAGPGHVTARRRARGPDGGRRRLRRRTPRGAAARPLGRRAAERAAQRRAGRARPQGGGARAARRRGRAPPCIVEVALATGLVAEGTEPDGTPAVAADRRVRRLVGTADLGALGAAGRRLAGEQPGAVAGRRGATPPARRGTRSPPSCPAGSPRRRAAWPCRCSPRCPTARCWPPAPASRRSCSGSAGCARAGRRSSPTSSPPPSSEAAVLGVSGAGGAAAERAAGGRPATCPAPRRRSTRTSRARSSRCCSRPT